MQLFICGRTFFIYILILISRDLNAQTAGTWVLQGDSLHELYDTEGAYKSYKSALDLDGENFEALWKTADELIELGDVLPKSADQEIKYSEAVKFARKAVAVNPDHSDGHLILAMAIEKTALYKSGKEKLTLLNEVKMEAQRSLELNVQKDMAHCLIGRWNRSVINTNWLVKGMVKLIDRTIIGDASNEQAIVHFNAAIKINGSYPPYYIELGKTFVFMDKWNDAKGAFEKVLDIVCTSKYDRRWKRDAKSYLQLLNMQRYSDLKDAVEE